MSTEGNSTQKGQIATRIITQAQKRNHRARSNYLEARQMSEEVPWQIHHELQAAVMEFYQALRPLREHSAIEEFWQTVEICEIQTGWTPIEKNGRIVDYEAKTETIEGFQSLESLTAQRTVEEKTISDSFGERTIQTENRDLVDGHILIKTSQKLDDAATKLGFGPNVDESTPRTEIDDELMEKVEEWRRSNIE